MTDCRSRHSLAPRLLLRRVSPQSVALCPLALLAPSQASQYWGLRGTTAHALLPVRPIRAHLQFTHAAIHSFPSCGARAKALCPLALLAPSQGSPRNSPPKLSSRAQSRDLRFAKQYPGCLACQQPRMAAKPRVPVRPAPIIGKMSVPPATPDPKTTSEKPSEYP